MTNDDRVNWEGGVERECGEHHTVGPHRAWCLDCSEWCYPPGNCKGCELPALRAENARLRTFIRAYDNFTYAANIGVEYEHPESLDAARAVLGKIE